MAKAHHRDKQPKHRHARKEHARKPRQRGGRKATVTNKGGFFNN